MKIFLNKSPYIIIATIIFVVQLIVTVYYVSEPGLKAMRKQQNNYAPNYIYQLKEKSNTILQKISKELAVTNSYSDISLQNIVEKGRYNYDVVEVDPVILTLDRKYVKPKLYVWLSDTSNNLISGFPSSELGQVNARFKKDYGLIQSDAYYKNQNEYFSIVLGFDLNNLDQYNWRFNEEFKSKEIQRRRGRFYFSKEQFDAEGNLVGTLYLKMDDSKNKWIIYADREHETWQNQRKHVILTNLFGFLLLWMMLPSWVYNDARKRGLRNPVMWALLPLFSFLIGFGIYFLARKKLTVEMEALSTCKSCEHQLPLGSKFCPSCGTATTSKNQCSNCNKKVENDWLYCPSCQSELS